MSETPLDLAGFRSGSNQDSSSPSGCFLLERLPLELHQKIYSYIYTPWSLAIFDADDDHELDETVTLVKVGVLALGGPPGRGLLLACRDLYNLVKHYYGRDYTGRIYTGQVLRLSTVAKNLPRAFRKWYIKTQSLSSICPQRDCSVVTYFTRVFRSVRVFDCVMYNRTLNSDLQRLGIQYVLDDRMTGRWSALKVASHFYNNHPRLSWLNPRETPSPVDEYTLNLKFIAYDTSESGNPIVAGIHLQYRGRQQFTIARIARERKTLSYWEEGMSGTEKEVIHVETEDDIPERMRWVALPQRHHSELGLKGI